MPRAPAQPPPVAPSPTVGEFWDTYLGDARSRLARPTIESYESVYRRRVQPRFGHVPMGELRPRAVSRWRAALLADGTGAESARRAMVLSQAMFTVPLEWGEVQSNPVALVRKSRQGRDHAVQPLTPEAVEAIRAELLDVGDRRSATLTALMANAGLRPGETLGLAVRHIRATTVLVERPVSDAHDDVAAWVAEAQLDDPVRMLFVRADGRPWMSDDWINWRDFCGGEVDRP